MNYEKAKNYIIERLKKGLPGNLHYHNLEHTYDVLTTAAMYAVAEGVNGDDFVLLRTAAVYHDCGFIVQYDDHEFISSKIAEANLPKFGYTPQQVKKISKIILATKIIIEPETLLEEILRDSDLDYLGREDFHIRAQRLKIEYYEQGIIQCEKDWEEGQLKFMEKHRYYTKTAQRLRNSLKEKHIRELRELFEKY